MPSFLKGRDDERKTGEGGGGRRREKGWLLERAALSHRHLVGALRLDEERGRVKWRQREQGRRRGEGEHAGFRGWLKRKPGISVTKRRGSGK